MYVDVYKEDYVELKDVKTLKSGQRERKKKKYDCGFHLRIIRKMSSLMSIRYIQELMNKALLG